MIFLELLLRRLLRQMTFLKICSGRKCKGLCPCHRPLSLHSISPSMMTIYSEECQASAVQILLSKTFSMAALRLHQLRLPRPLKRTSTLGEAVLDELLPGFGATEHDKPKSPEDGQPSQYNNSKPVNGFSANIVEDPFAVSDADTLPDAHFPTVPLSPGFPEGTTEHPYVSDLKKDSSETETCMPKKRSPNLGQRSTDTSVPIDNRDVPNPMGVNDDDVISKEYQRKMSDSAAADSSRIATSVDATIPGSSVHRDNAMQSGEADDFSKRRQSFRVSAVSRSKGREEEASQIPNPSRSRRVDEYWISVENVKLVTRPSTAPPPARSPPLPDSRHSYSQRKPSQNGRATENGGHSPTGSHVNGGLDSADSTLEDLEAFASGRPLCADADEKDYGASSQGGSDLGSATATASGAAMRDAIEKAEAKLQRAKEAKDKKMEEVRGTTNKEGGTRQRRETDSTEKWLKEREKEKQRERERDREKDGANEIACQRAAADARERLERAAAEKAKVQQAAAAEQKDADKGRMAASKDQHQKNEDDLDSFFRASSRPTSEPKQRTHPSDGFRTAQQSDEGFRRNISTAGNVKKVSSMPSMADDLTSLFGGPSSGNGTFQEVEGETEERRKARWDRHQRMLERTAKALEEKRQRDLQSVKEQEERHRAAELVDAEIKRWAAGKEGNLRALLSSLHYVLWPECGWQPVSLTDLITSSAVKKVYKKATLHVHPDKVQQKGATSRQKYIAEKVFDLLKEAWNKFNAEELF
ncbi:hypothetical protein KP509_18G023400 [Ceratopteris richardii]|uniref:Uncharacterized protein n=1 Tax=Ceratopteris richardii TaxID=49495 RepID=A0A8T2SN47_CERRI|nr:hypothetical protein KP509_18G023400 [Ceratopteris richardii]